MRGRNIRRFIRAVQQAKQDAEMQFGVQIVGIYATTPKRRSKPRSELYVLVRANDIDFTDAVELENYLSSAVGTDIHVVVDRLADPAVVADAMLRLQKL